MSILSKTLLAAAVTLAVAGAANAASEPWVLQSNMGYVVDMKGNAMVVNLDDVSKMHMKKAKMVPRGTVFFMHDGHLMMMRDTSIDR